MKKGDYKYVFTFTHGNELIPNVVPSYSDVCRITSWIAGIKLISVSTLKPLK